VQSKNAYLQSQVGNPEGPDKPNKKVRGFVCDVMCAVVYGIGIGSIMTRVCGLGRGRRRFLRVLRRRVLILGMSVRVFLVCFQGEGGLVMVFFVDRL
jgi:hypothetical protein